MFMSIAVTFSNNRFRIIHRLTTTENEQHFYVSPNHNIVLKTTSIAWMAKIFWTFFFQRRGRIKNNDKKSILLLTQ